MLGDRKAGGGGDEAGRGRDVDQPRAVAPGAAAVGEEVIGAIERGRGGGQSVGGTDHLLGGLALHAERNQHPANLARLQFAEHQPLEQMLAVVDGQVLARQQFGQRIERTVVRQIGGAWGGGGVVGGNCVGEHG